MLERLEGHFIRGYGDSQKPDAELYLLPQAISEANEFLQSECDSLNRLRMVSTLIDGFETPYGMELLASIHWLATHENPTVVNAQQAVIGIQRWNQRKQKMFQPGHVQVAWQRLSNERFVAAE